MADGDSSPSGASLGPISTSWWPFVGEKPIVQVLKLRPKVVRNVRNATPVSGACQGSGSNQEKPSLDNGSQEAHSVPSFLWGLQFAVSVPPLFHPILTRLPWSMPDALISAVTLPGSQSL